MIHYVMTTQVWSMVRLKNVMLQMFPVDEQGDAVQPDLTVAGQDFDEVGQLTVGACQSDLTCGDARLVWEVGLKWLPQRIRRNVLVEATQGTVLIRF